MAKVIRSVEITTEIPSHRLSDGAAVKLLRRTMRVRLAGAGLVVTPLELDNGYLRVPETPGIGFELNFAVVEKMPLARREFNTPLHEDGSVADQ
jgi:hypothetical protein